jgi:hypothetical protein
MNIDNINLFKANRDMTRVAEHVCVSASCTAHEQIKIKSFIHMKRPRGPSENIYICIVTLMLHLI